MKGSSPLLVKGNLRRYITGISIMNGIEWHEDYNQMYVVDTIPKKVYSFHYDEVRGELGAQRVMVGCTGTLV